VTTAHALSSLRQRVEDEYRSRTPRSWALHQQAQASLPGGDTRHGTLFQPYPTYIDAGHGSYLVDVDGNELLDFTLNSTSLIHGHAHPAIVQAIQQQAGRGTAWNAPSAVLVELAELLCARIPSLENVRFCNSGTEANMHALKAARAFSGRDLILKMDGAYHGTYEGVELNMGVPAPRAVAATAGVPRNAADNVLLATFNDRESAAQLIRTRRHELAAVVVTPILTRPALGLPAAGYLDFLRQVTADSGVLLVFDEVISLRVGPGGAQDRYGVVPDLTAMGKIIGGGLPVGAFGGRADVMRVFADGDPPSVAHAGTFNGNPLTAAAGLVSMQLLTDAAFERLAVLGERLHTGLQATVERLGLALAVTSAGSLVSLDIGAAVRADPLQSAASAEFMRLVQLALLVRGIKTSGLLAVSTVTTEAEIDRLVESTADVLDRCGSAIPALLRATPQPVEKCVSRQCSDLSMRRCSARR
jgi:glutamate-1-semialdehyde 2,1-aminomutase